jgi:hypothetical protein
MITRNSYQWKAIDRCYLIRVSVANRQTMRLRHRGLVAVSIAQSEQQTVHYSSLSPNNEQLEMALVTCASATAAALACCSASYSVCSSFSCSPVIVMSLYTLRLGNRFVCFVITYFLWLLRHGGVERRFENGDSHRLFRHNALRLFDCRCSFRLQSGIDSTIEYQTSEGRIC